MKKLHCYFRGKVLRGFSTASSTSWKNSKLVDRSQFIDGGKVGENDLQIVENVISTEEELWLVEECNRLFRRRRYEKNHWDNVIVDFKEIETTNWTSESKAILDRVRLSSIIPQDLPLFPAVHVIDLAEKGYIQPHVDSIKFSGKIVSGLSLLSPSIMRFQEENGSSVLDAYLPRRSLYTMSGEIRFKYTHEILPGNQLFKEQEIIRTRRISIMFRDFVQSDS